MLIRCCLVLLLAAVTRMNGQEASSGFSVPVTISGTARYQRAPESESGMRGDASAGFRAVLYPTLRLSNHWFVYSVLDAHSSSYFTYKTGTSEDRPIEFNVTQAFVGYTTAVKQASLLIKAGQLSSAFGLAPLEYDDAKMTFTSLPLPYTSNLPLRPDQTPCDISDVLAQNYGGAVAFPCRGTSAESYGIVPITLYGLPGIQAEVSIARVDARFQLTNSSPANPHGLTSHSQFPQWTAGGGYTLRGGLHAGVSAFRGPYLDRSVESTFPAGRTVKDFPASGFGIDAQWSRGSWTTQGEWQYFRFALPGFVTSPAEYAAYGQLKKTVSPRLYAAVRITSQRFGRIEDRNGWASDYFAGPQQVYELAVGYRLYRQQLIKTGLVYMDQNQWSAGDWFWPRASRYGVEFQLVTSFTPLSKAFGPK